ncbi:MAG: family 1 glycosylhydrolase, partial [Eubacterium sp.]|nr:family 1 glycosylhydrolase [Eubacterium sp.]
KGEIDLASMQNRFNFSVKTNSCLNLKLRNDWNKYGANSFTFEILEEVEMKSEMDRRQFKKQLDELADKYSEKMNEDGTVHDDYRINYIKEHIMQIKEAIHDGVNVIGYYPWGPIDLVSCSSSEMELITRRVIERLENGNVTDEVLEEYANPDSEKYECMVEEIRKELNFTSLRFNRLDDMLDSVGIDKSKLCTFCWDGKE